MILNNASLMKTCEGADVPEMREYILERGQKELRFFNYEVGSVGRLHCVLMQLVGRFIWCRDWFPVLRCGLLYGVV